MAVAIGPSGHLNVILETVYMASRPDTGEGVFGLVMVTHISTDVALHNQSAPHQAVPGDLGAGMDAVQGPVAEVHSTDIVPVQPAVTVEGPTECHGGVIHGYAAEVKIL